MTARKIINKVPAFTLIELLVVIGILAILLTITLIAINPGRQFQQSNDTKRSSDVNAILNAVQQYAADHKGQLPVGMTNVATTPFPVRRSATPDPTTEADLCAGLVTDYIAALPSDPTHGSGAGANGASITETVCSDATATGAYDTGYTIVKSAGLNNRLTVTANGEITTPISVTR
jgi:prepilin-type N-terminal cleavage/methylation domain-containing protein